METRAQTDNRLKSMGFCTFQIERLSASFNAFFANYGDCLTIKKADYAKGAFYVVIKNKVQSELFFESITLFDGWLLGCVNAIHQLEVFRKEL